MQAASTSFINESFLTLQSGQALCFVILKCGYRLNTANRQNRHSVGVDPQIDPKRRFIVLASRFRADEGISPYDAGFSPFQLILPILLSKADIHIK